MVAPAEYPRFAICGSEEDGGTRLTVTGELDPATAPTLRDRLRQSRANRRDVRLDLSKLEFVDCAGINVPSRRSMTHVPTECGSTLKAI